MEKYPDFSSSIIRDLAGGWVASERQSYNLGVRKNMERLADFLLSLHSDAGNPETEIEFPLTRETLATLIGTTTESVIRTLSDFRARGWIEYTSGKIRLRNIGELRRLVIES